MRVASYRADMVSVAMLWSAYHCVHGTSCLCTLSASAFMHWVIPTSALFIFRNLFMEIVVINGLAWSRHTPVWLLSYPSIWQGLSHFGLGIFIHWFGPFCFGVIPTYAWVHWYDISTSYTALEYSVNQQQFCSFEYKPCKIQVLNPHSIIHMTSFSVAHQLRDLVLHQEVCAAPHW